MNTYSKYSDAMCPGELPYVSKDIPITREQVRNTLVTVETLLSRRIASFQCSIGHAIRPTGLQMWAIYLTTDINLLVATLW